MASHTTKRFREALATLPSHIRQAAETAYEKWKGINEQTDDVTVIGIRI